MTAFGVLVRHDLRTTRRSALVWIIGLTVTSITTVRGYLAAYPTAAGRAQVAADLGANPAFQAIYGAAFRLDTVGGFSSWRVGGLLVLLAAAWLLSMTNRLTRGEEAAGRSEAVLGQAVVRSAPARAAAVVGLGWAAVLWLALWLAFGSSGVPWRGSALIALMIAACGAVGVGVGSLVAQVADSPRRANGVGGAVMGVAFLLRVIADGTRHRTWLRWCTPFGWAEEIRPFAGSQLVALLPLSLFVTVLVATAVAVAARRDLGAGVLTSPSSRPPRPFGLEGNITFGVRAAAPGLAAWLVALGVFSFVLGSLSKDVATFAKNQAGFTKVIGRLGVADLARPAAFLGLCLAFIAVAVAIYAAGRAGATRDEESGGLADHLLVRQVSRRGWLVTRALTSVVATVILTLGTGLAMWAGSAAQGAAVGLGELLRGGLNLAPVAVFVIGVATLTTAFAPRATRGVAYTVVLGGYLLQLIGALIQAPAWVLDLSPFHHVAPVPAAAVNVGAAWVLGLVGLALIGVAADRFARRDITLA